MLYNIRNHSLYRFCQQSVFKITRKIKHYISGTDAEKSCMYRVQIS
jgi:hypothetical protein